MDWTRAFDAYCERTDPFYWSEPVNALSNIAFLVAAAVMWGRTRGLRDGRVLSGILLAIGLGSYLFHTHATLWAVTLDVIPILLFSLFYIFLANRDFCGLPVWLSAVGALAYIPYSAAVGWVASDVPFLRISSEYWSLPILIALYAIALSGKDRVLAWGLAMGAALLSMSLVARSLDGVVCAAFPLGTHFLWHLLNALMLAWMIEVWARQTRAAR